jgi:hypothetical protein
MSFFSRLIGGDQEKPKRRPPFKERYDLNRRQPIKQFEQKMLQGMQAEQKEIFVTAFCNNDEEVLQVTASVGSRKRCSPADDYTNWGIKAKRIEATEIRQYHNHVVKGDSGFSKQDKKTYPIYREHVKPFGVSIRFFLVYPRRLIGGYGIKEF